MTDAEALLSGEDVASVVRQFPAFIAVYEGPELRCVLANEAARAIVGGRSFEGLPLREALPEFETQQIVDLVEQVYARGEPARAEEWRVQLGDPAGGPPIEVFANFDAVPWRDADGALRGVITTGTLVTDMVLARRAADSHAADLADRYRRVRADVSELQRVLLPTGLPVVSSAEVAAFYRVAGSEDAAGGDWFDCLPVPGDRLGIVVGDVVGHGIEASAAMAQLRAVLAEMLADGEQLPAVVARLDRFARRAPETRAATVCIAVFDPASSTVDYCTLGHPAPLLVRADGAARYLPPTGGSPLGSLTADTAIEVGVAELGPDDVLMLYTDGLVERPGEDLEAGLRTLAQVAGDAAAGRLLPTGAPASAADRVGALTVEVLTRAGTADDVTVVVLQPRLAAPAALRWSIEGTAQLAEVRGAVAEWAHALAIGEDAVADLQLLVTEAMSNSLEHAYPDGPAGPVALCLELGSDGLLRCEVTDRGRWRAPATSANRGRGLSLIRTLSRNLRIETSADGTAVSFETEPFRTAVLIGAPPAPIERAEPAFAADVSLEPQPTVAVRGVVDTATASSLAAAIGRAGRGGTRSVLVDLRECRQLASAGVRVLLDAAATEGGVRLRVRPGRSPHTVVRLVGLAGLVNEDPA